MLSAKKLIENYRFFFLFIILIGYFLVRAMNNDERIHGLATICFFSIILYSLYIIGREKPFILKIIFFIGLTQVSMAALFDIYHLEHYSIIRLLSALIFYLIMSFECLQYTFEDKVITQSTLFGALCAYLLIGQCFTSVYVLIYQFEPLSFSGLSSERVNINSDLIYFSFVTITTLGYGDILPVSKMAKTLAWMESYMGQAYLTILMALLVGRFINQKNN